MQLFTVRRRLAIIGLASAFLALVAQLLVAGGPSTGQQPAVIRDWFINHRELVLIAAYLAAPGLTAHLALIVVIRDRLREAEGRSAVVAGLIIPATVLWLSVVMIGLGSFTAAAYRPSEMSAETVRNLYDAAYLAFGAAGFGTALALGAASWIVLQTRTFPRWFGWLGILAIVLHLIAAAALARTGGATPQNGSLVAIIYYAWATAGTVLIWRSPTVSGNGHIA